MRQATLADFGIIEKPLSPSSTVPPSGQHRECFAISENHITHPLLKPQTVQYREFQLNLASLAVERSTLVVLPTGLGKTVIAAMVAADVKAHRGGQILFLAPTKPLPHQHLRQRLKQRHIGGINLASHNTVEQSPCGRVRKQRLTTRGLAGEGSSPTSLNRCGIMTGH